MPARPQLTLREIVLGLLAGAAAAGGAAAVLSAIQDDDAPRVVAAEQPRRFDNLAPFDEISTMGPQDVVVTHGDVQSVRAEGPAEALAQLEAVVVDGELRIRPKGPSFDRNQNRAPMTPFDWEQAAAVTFYVTAPRLERVSLAGSGEVTVDRVEGERFEGRVAGPGEMAIATLEVGKADLSIGGTGSLTAAGVADETRVSIGGTGEVEADRLTSETASISIGGSGDVGLTVTRRALISIAGSGNVEISGPASCSVSRMGSGAVSCGGDPQ